MKVHNIRLGFATNSSSTHSFAFNRLRKNIAENDDYDNSFGWDFFTLASKEAKDEYMSVMLSDNLKNYNGFAEDLVDVILKGLDLPLPDTESYIDHQSLYILPKEYGSDNVSIQFFKEFREFITKDGVFILGGNDNSSENHPMWSEVEEITFDKFKPEYGDWICRKDDEWWILYNTKTGNRAVFSFEENPKEFKPVTPLLIDFKISNFCDIGCAFCYQGSTKNGNHILPDDIYGYVKDIRGAEIFEVAIGGGEPTECPSFIPFLRELNRNKVKANFTTKSIEWLENEPMAREILPLIGAFAYSADNTKVIQRIVDIFNYRGYDKNKFNVQIIPAVLTEYTFKNILTFCGEHNIKVTLLGFKETGRGAKFKEIAVKRMYDKFNEDKWLDVIKKLSEKGECPTIGIDTTLASKYKNNLKEIDLPNWLFHVEEGKYSAYIDAVDNKFGPSSYHLDKLIDFGKYDYYSNRIETAFAKIESV